VSIAATWTAEHDIIAAEQSAIAYISRELLEKAIGGPVSCAKNEMVQDLHKVSLLRSLPTRTLDLLSKIAKVRVYADGQYVCR
jgi:hypothetical protein